IGASSGRAMIACLHEGKIQMEEIHRFQNHSQENADGSLFWDVENLFEQILIALTKAKELGKQPDSIAVDTWGVDYVLVDEQGKPLEGCHSYRDPKRDFANEVHERIRFEELYSRTGIQFQRFNTIYQLYADSLSGVLTRAHKMLMLPDYLNYRLTGVMKQEYCNATTTGMVNAKTHEWDKTIIDRLGYPRKLFLPLSQPGESVGRFSRSIRRKVGFDAEVVLPATHDTASAVLAIPLKPGEAYLSSGTWSLLGAENPIAELSEKGRLANYSNEGSLEHSFRVQKNILGLWMIQEVRHELGDSLSFAEIVEKARESAASEIIPCNDPRFLSPASMRKEIEEAVGRPLPIGDLARIVFSSLAYCYKESLEELEDLLGKHYPVLHITGGGGNNAFLNELTAKAINRPVIVGPIEGTAIGNILMQMIHCGEIASLSQGREIIKESFECWEVQP
ncbi:MAG: rhamnulokinase, partial [Bacilli bacterium]|nr:rhamnulokinase [Bacilli bacterium]